MTDKLYAGPAVLALGFRPFYLLALLFAASSVPLWIAVYLGLVPLDGYLSGSAWHSHEMVFGFASAVIAGFLLTAVRNWTGRSTPTGLLLAGMVALWCVARVLMVTGPALAAAIVDLLFLPVLAIAIAVPIWRSRNTRNFKLLVVLAALTIANLVFHLTSLHVLPQQITNNATTAALDVIAILVAIIAGRVIPAFTSGAVENARPRRIFAIEALAIGSLLLILIADTRMLPFRMAPTSWVVLTAVASAAHMVRLMLWNPHRTIHNPLLLMLPIAYAWLPIALTLRGLAQLEMASAASAVHALTIGLMSSLMVAMMTRSALGHTGRLLVAGPCDIAAFVILQIAAVVRVFAGTVSPEYYRGAVIASGMLWTLAFSILVLCYWPILTRPRIDGRPG